MGIVWYCVAARDGSAVKSHSTTTQYRQLRRLSAIQRQKFHPDDVKSVRNPVRSAGWSTEKLHCFSDCLRMTVLTDKRQKATEVKCKCEESLTKQSTFVDYSLL